jgi:hypothetical protein
VGGVVGLGAGCLLESTRLVVPVCHNCGESCVRLYEGCGVGFLRAFARLRCRCRSLCSWRIASSSSCIISSKTAWDCIIKSKTDVPGSSRIINSKTDKLDVGLAAGDVLESTFMLVPEWFTLRCRNSSKRTRAYRGKTAVISRLAVTADLWWPVCVGVARRGSTTEE